MYKSKYYTCEEIDERLLKGYYDDAVSNGYSDTFEQFKIELAQIKDIADNKAQIAENTLAIQKLSDSVKNMGLNYISISTLNAMTPVGLAPSCLANNPTQPLRSIVFNNDIVIGYVNTYSDEFGFIVLQTFHTRANIDADGNIISYDNNIVHTYTRSSGVSDDTWINKWRKTSIEENSPALFGFLPWGSENDGPDNLDFTAILNNEQPSTYYMTRVLGGENIVVGVLQCYSDSMLHGFVQTYESIEFLNSEGKFDGSHSHTELKKYSRYYGRDYDGYTFTAWKEVGGIGDGSITEVKLSDTVKNLLLHRIDWSNLHTAKLGKYVVINNSTPVGYVNTLSVNESYRVQIFTTTMVYDETNVTFVSGTSYSKINTYIRRYSIQHDEWGDWEEIDNINSDIDLSSYYTKEEIDNKLKGYATKEDLNNIGGGGDIIIDLSEYVKRVDLERDYDTKEEIDNKLRDYDTKEEIDIKLRDYATKEDLNNIGGGGDTNIDLSEYVKRVDLERDYAKKSDIPIIPDFKTINGQSIIGEGDITIESPGGGEPTITIDDTLTEDSPNPVKSSGIYNGIKTMINAKFVVLTEAEYKAMDSHNANTFYYIKQ